MVGKRRCRSFVCSCLAFIWMKLVTAFVVSSISSTLQRINEDHSYPKREIECETETNDLHGMHVRPCRSCEHAFHLCSMNYYYIVSEVNNQANAHNRFPSRHMSRPCSPFCLHILCRMVPSLHSHKSFIKCGVVTVPKLPEAVPTSVAVFSPQARRRSHSESVE